MTDADGQALAAAVRGTRRRGIERAPQRVFDDDVGAGVRELLRREVQVTAVLDQHREAARLALAG